MVSTMLFRSAGLIATILASLCLLLTLIVGND
jgi:hypothetical protein